MPEEEDNARKVDKQTDKHTYTRLMLFLSSECLRVRYLSQTSRPAPFQLAPTFSETDAAEQVMITVGGVKTLGFTTAEKEKRQTWMRIRRLTLKLMTPFPADMSSTTLSWFN